MPVKRDPYSSYGQKLISLFARLSFSRERHSLTELSRWLKCSKQTILRLVDDIRRSYGVDIEETMEGRRKYYRIKQLTGVPLPLNLTQKELNALYMCRSFAEHLLGRELFEEATRALEKSKALLSQDKASSFHHFASFRPGSIDYTPHRDAINTILEAMEKKRICMVRYRSIMINKARTFYIKPMKIFSYYDTVYLHAGKARRPGKPFKTPDYDPLLAIHRIKKIEMTERMFEIPKDYDFEKTFNRNFGVIKENAFRIKIEFRGYSARYAAERMWSPDQKIVKKKGDKIVLSFTSSSEEEVISWLLSFWDEAKVLEPDWLVDKVRGVINRMEELYA